MPTTTKQYVVRFRRGPGDIPEEATFNTQGPAYALAYKIENEGGIALMLTVDKDDPLNNSGVEKKLEF